MFDAVLAKSPDFTVDNPSFYVDVHKSMKEAFAETFYKYKTKKSASLHSMGSVLEVTAAFTPGLVLDQQPGESFHWTEEGDWDEFQKAEGREIKGYTAFVDPRLAFLGARTISFEGTLETEGDDIETGTEDDYHCYRLLHGIAEGPVTAGLLPLNMNFDVLNCISFNKGCYIGQELTQRTHIQGEVRTVLLPFIQHSSIDMPNVANSSMNLIDKKVAPANIGQQIVDSSGLPIGKVVESKYNAGLAMVKTELLHGDRSLRLEEGSAVMVWRPIWHGPSSLDH